VYGTLEIGAAFDPSKHDPLFIPTTGDAYPNWTPEHLPEVLAKGGEGKAVVLQFHGVPDVAHPWVHTPPENFVRYMRYLKEHGYRAIAVRDLEQYIDRSVPPDDPITRDRFPRKTDGALPVEVQVTRANPKPWLANMRQHKYSAAEAAMVIGFTEQAIAAKWQAQSSAATAPLRPYPGGRHPRIGFLDGAIDPMRGTKCSLFLPGGHGDYLVVDVPEAIFSNLGLLFLAHTHIPTIWNEQNKVIDNVDWEVVSPAELRSKWTLPNGVSFGAGVKAAAPEVNMELWLTNGTEAPLTGLRTQVCVMLKGTPAFAAQTNDNKRFEKPLAVVQAGERRVMTSWENCNRTWGNADCPCMHSDPTLPDCAPGQTVRVRGRLWWEGMG
jgi:hypothetical protein